MKNFLSGRGLFISASVLVALCLPLWAAAFLLTIQINSISAPLTLGTALLWLVWLYPIYALLGLSLAALRERNIWLLLTTPSLLLVILAFWVSRVISPF